MGIVGGGAVGVIGLASPRESLRNKGHALYSDVAANRQARLCNDRGGAVRAYRVDVPTEFVWNDQVTAKRTEGRWRHSQPSLEGRTCSGDRWGGARAVDRHDDAPAIGSSARQQSIAKLAGRVEGGSVEGIDAGYGRKRRCVALRIDACDSNRGVKPQHE